MSPEAYDKHDNQQSNQVKLYIQLLFDYSSIELN